jgi:hypothetical protein
MRLLKICISTAGNLVCKDQVRSHDAGTIPSSKTLVWLAYPDFFP